MIWKSLRSAREEINAGLPPASTFVYVFTGIEGQ